MNEETILPNIRKNIFFLMKKLETETSPKKILELARKLDVLYKAEQALAGRFVPGQKKIIKLK